MQDTYNIKKVGVGVITFLSLATASTSIHSTSMTSGMADMHSYASAYVIMIIKDQFVYHHRYLIRLREIL